MMPVREAIQKELGAYALNDERMGCQGHFIGAGMSETTAGGEVGGGVAKQWILDEDGDDNVSAGDIGQELSDSRAQPPDEDNLLWYQIIL